MILLYLLLIPILGACLGLGCSRKSNLISTLTLTTVFVLTLASYWLGESRTGLEDFWLLEFKKSWFYLGLDGFSFVMLLLSEIMAGVGLVLLIHKPKEQFLLLTTLSGLLGLFLAVDLLAFFVFWELMLIPVYFWVLLFGKERKIFAASQFIIFTQASGLILLGAIVALYSFTGTLDTNQIANMTLPRSVEFWIASALTLAFLIKLPAFPFHVWMPSLFRDAPVAAIISGLLIKTGAYGILRFVLPLFPRAALTLAPSMILLGGIGVIYGAVLAFSQKNPRKVLAYSTLSHASLMLMGLFSNHLLALSGSIVLIVTHALAAAGLFVAIEAHLGFTLFFAMALLGLPGLGNFVGELLLLFGLFQKHPIATIVGASSLVLSAAYMLRLISQIYYGSERPNTLSKAPLIACSVLAALILWIGLTPAPLLDLIEPSWTEDITVVEPEQPEGDDA